MCWWIEVTCKELGLTAHPRRFSDCLACLAREEDPEARKALCEAGAGHQTATPADPRRGERGKRGDMWAVKVSEVSFSAVVGIRLVDEKRGSFKFGLSPVVSRKHKK